MLLGWVTNNYWETNFPDAQPGVVTARTSTLPYAGGFDETCAHMFAAEAEHSRPVLQHMGEAADEKLLPSLRTLFNLPQPPILTLGLRRFTKNGIMLTLLNSSDCIEIATLSSGLLQVKSAWRCDLFGNKLKPLSVINGVLEVSIASRRNLTIILEA